jgi:hypothetical protein
MPTPGVPSEFVDTFRRYYGSTMNAFDAAEKNGKSEDLRKELEALFESRNKSQTAGTTSIPATFLRVTVQVKWQCDGCGVLRAAVRVAQVPRRT